ncbi:hypothetical protein ERJ75_000928800 [Trypanosoma vivax]|uniref:RanBP2-type domain-containing protein n=1 Tax=Trypanosoma vivax (strain Y486) TaxID=1055687 RepID=G0U3Z7_TRYVY|nr:hypothetical protein TRVL_02119 [Trypanosoma vivax]KAH8612109.1 hypothetical protein ERJ75_000928800 [Trypanosoma vivax]CCC52159.1 conserved hypothetical protein [Trypanosoma vivax Y486]
MRRWICVAKKTLRPRTAVLDIELAATRLPEEHLVMEKEFPCHSPRFSYSGDTLVAELTHHRSLPFAVLALQAGGVTEARLDIMWFSLLLAMRTGDAFLREEEARLFSGTSIAGSRCAFRAVSTLSKQLKLQSSTNAEMAIAHLVILLLRHTVFLPTDTGSEGIDVAFLESEIGALKHPLPFCLLQLLLAAPVAPSLLAHLVHHELKKCCGTISWGLFCACMNGLLANDCFYSTLHFNEMHAIMLEIIEHIHPTFDFISVRWTPILNKLSRIYMRQYQGEALYTLHRELLCRIPPLETKVPLTYLLHCMGSLVDAGVAKVDGSDTWEKIVALGNLTIRLYGSAHENTHTIWTVLFKGAVTLEPQCVQYHRVIEAYQLFASLGYPITLERGAFSQIVRMLINTVNRLTLEETTAAIHRFYAFLQTHPSVHFTWVVDSLLPIMTSLWESNGTAASLLVQELMQQIKDDYFPSRQVTGIRLEDNATLRHLLESFGVVCKADFFWRCGCGAELPSSAQHCSNCLRKGHGSWTCPVCGAKREGASVSNKCDCGAQHPRILHAECAAIKLCASCGGTLDANSECGKCKMMSLEKELMRMCSFCGNSYSHRCMCCPTCYQGNEEKKPLLWRCDACMEYNHGTWSKCQRCPGKRKVGSVVTPMKAWVCGCGKRNNPCRTSCEGCSASQRGTYTCDECKKSSSMRSLLDLSAGATCLRVIACENCGTIHPRDRNVLYSPYLSRRCHACGRAYTRTDARAEAHCKFCLTAFRYNELEPFRCESCCANEMQVGFQCASCGAPRPGIACQDVFVWRCLREATHITQAGTEPATCGMWNYSWSDHCLRCGEGRAHSDYECRARFLPWVCTLCEHSNLPTDVLLCPKCDEGLQLPSPCPICGFRHIALDCSAPFRY